MEVGFRFSKSTCPDRPAWEEGRAAVQGPPARELLKRLSQGLD